MIKPKPLLPGARLAVVSPASTPRPEHVEAGMRELRGLGYEPILYPSALKRGPLYYAGTVEERVADLHAAFADDAIEGIVCTRGGWGSAELLPFLDMQLIRSHPKAFIGYSDHTSLHMWLHQVTEMVTFYGPMVAADLSRPEGQDRATWQHALEGSASWTVGARQGLRVLRGGTAKGTLIGGCLSLITESLGTPYAPSVWDGILFLEDIGTKPYQWDRMLLHLRYAGLLNHAKGIVFGDMRQCWLSDAEGDAPFEASILHALRHFPGPIAIGLQSGHVSSGNVTLPLGVQVRLDLTDAANPRMDFLEAALEG